MGSCGSSEYPPVGVALTKQYCPCPKCSVLFLQRQLRTHGLPLSHRKGLSPRVLKTPGTWSLDMGDPAAQVSWWLLQHLLCFSGLWENQNPGPSLRR